MVEATIPAEQFALYETLTRYPSVKFDILRLVASGSGRTMPFLWAVGDDLDNLLGTIDEDPSTENVEVIAELEEEYLLRMEWMAQIRFILYVLIEEDATIIDAKGKNESWRFQILFPEHNSVSKTHEFCDEYGIGFEFERIYQLSDSLRRGQFGLSEGQYDAIVKAFQKGYYEIPRGVNLQELATQMDVSHQALSERVRRGHQTLIANALQPALESAPKS
jgi:predicted DNA binding protein